jgi:uracil-DNA glycosylase
MAESNGDLDRVAKEASTCTRCRLHESRTQVVFGQGSPTADLMFVGEAPGFHEDRKGYPFVGPSGQLLNRLLGEIGLRREDVYICNVVKCRPPANRDPRPDEIETCGRWLDAQLRLIDPKVIVTLGNFASKTLLGTSTGITRLRGRTYEFEHRVLLPTFHPSAALRADTSGRTENRTLNGMREDFQALARLLAERKQGSAGPSEAPGRSGTAASTARPSGTAASTADREGAAGSGPSGAAASTAGPSGPSSAAGPSAAAGASGGSGAAGLLGLAGPPDRAGVELAEGEQLGLF